MSKYDCIFIGSGHSCWHGALALAVSGKKVAIVEKSLLGGASTNNCCNSKILLNSPIELYESVSRYNDICINSKAKIDWTKLISYKDKVIGGMPNGLSNVLETVGINIIIGEAKFLNKNTIEVNNNKYKSKYFVIGTGQKSFPLGIEGEDFMHSPDDFLSLKTLPENITLIGSGPISVELAAIALSFGKKVNIVTKSDYLLKHFPKEYVNKLMDKMREQDVNFFFNSGVTEIVKEFEQFIVKTEDGSQVMTDYVVLAGNGKANLNTLNLGSISVKYSERGIKVDSHLRTNHKNIYVAGDCVDRQIPKLLSVSEFESNYIAFDILDPFNGKIKYPVVPNVVFSFPRIGQVGVSISEAEINSNKYRIERIKMGEALHWLNKNQKEGHATIIFDRKNRLAGAAVYSDNAGGYVNILSIIISNKMSIRDIRKYIFSYATPAHTLINAISPFFFK